MLNIPTILSHTWFVYGGDVLLCFMWGLVGVALLSPVMLFDAIYKVHKVRGMYHFRGSYISLRNKHKKDIRFYGAICMGITVAVVSLFSVSYI